MLGDVVYKLYATIGLDTTELQSGLNGAKQQIQGSGMPTEAKKVSKAVTTAFVAAGTAMTGFIKGAIQTGMDFDAEMSAVKAVTQADAEEFELLRGRALEMGRTTVFTAEEAAEALYYMGLAGWDVKKSYDALPAVLALAASSGEDLATVSDIVTDSMTAFGMSADEAWEYADILAAAVVNSNTDVAMLGDAFKYVAPVAGQLQYTAEDTAFALGLMASSGIKASMAGTTLRSILSRLSNPTDDLSVYMEALGISLSDTDGNMYSLMELMELFREQFKEIGNIDPFWLQQYANAIADLEEQVESGTISQELYESLLAQTNEHFEEYLNPENLAAVQEMMARVASEFGGLRGMAGLLAIISASDEDFYGLAEAIYGSGQTFAKVADGSIVPYTEALEQGLEVVKTYNGAAEAMQDTMLDNLQGDVTLLKSAWSGFQIAFSDAFTPELRRVMPRIIEAVGRLTEKLADMDLAKLADNIALVAEKAIDFIGYLLEHSDQVIDFMTKIGASFLIGKGASAAKTGLTGIGQWASFLLTGSWTGAKVAGAATAASAGTAGAGAAGAATGASGGLLGFLTSPAAFPAMLAALGVWGMRAEGKTQKQYIEQSTLEADAILSEHLANIADMAEMVQSYELSGEEGSAVKAQEAMTAQINAVDQFVKAAMESGMSEDLARQMADAAVELGKRQADLERANESLNRYEGTRAEGKAQQDVAEAEAALAEAQAAYDQILAEVGATAENTTTTVSGTLGGLSGDAYVWGSDMMAEMANGMSAGAATSILPTVVGVAGMIASYLHHSEPDKGPLSDDSTWMPDMMEGFAEGIRAGAPKIRSAVNDAFDLHPAIGLGMGGGAGSGVNVTINVNGARYSDDESLAERISFELRQLFAREDAAYA